MDSDSEPSGDIYVSHNDALRMFDSCITWLLQQDEANTYNLSVLKPGVGCKKKVKFSTPETVGLFFRTLIS